MKTKKQGQKVTAICAKYAKVNTAIDHCNYNAEMIEAVKKHYSRIGTSSIKSVKNWLDEQIESKLTMIARALPDEGYSMGSVIKVICTKLVGIDDRTREYANSCKWRETYGYVKIRLTPDEYKNIECVGGIVTYIYADQRNKVKKCWWYAGKGQKQNFELIKVEGYVYAGYHSPDKAKALAGGLQNIELRKQAQKRAEQDQKQKLIWKKKVARATRMQYCYQDSINAHNCETGTKAFILRCQLDAGKRYRGSFLLKIAAEKSTSSLSYVKKMIEYKASKIVTK